MVREQLVQGEVAWRKTLKVAFCSATEEQARAFDRRSALRESPLSVGKWTCLKR